MLRIPPATAPERGVTLTELVIVMLIASLAMAGLVSFYMNSQATWVDGFSQAFTQREATSVIDDLSGHVRRAAGALATPIGADERYSQLDLFDAGDSVNPAYAFVWSAADSLIHEGPYEAGVWVDHGPLVTSIVDKFWVTSDPVLVGITLGLRTSQRQYVEISTTVAMANR